MTPDRFSGGSGEREVSGSWERTITLSRSSDTFIIQSRSYVANNLFGGVVWFGPHAAHGTVYVPLLVGMSTVPDTLSWAYQGIFNTSTSFWAHRNVLTLAQTKFSYIINDIQSKQQQLESASWSLINNMTIPLVNNNNQEEIQLITNTLINNANTARNAFIELLSYILFTYNDGYINQWKGTVFQSSATGYPSWWLNGVGYSNGPPPVNNKYSDLQ